VSAAPDPRAVPGAVPRDVPRVRLVGVSCGYERHVVLTDVTLDIPRRGVVALVGPNGAGKTTLLRTLLGLLPPRSGRIEYGPGQDGRPTPPRAGYAPQTDLSEVLFPVTALEVVLMGLTPGLALYGRPGRRQRERAQAALELLTVGALADKYRVPRICFVNKMDRIGANFTRTFEQIKSKLQGNPVAIQLPIGAEDKFVGIVDLVKMKAIRWKDETLGADYLVEEIPADMQAEAQAYREQLIEKVSEVDDRILEKYLHGDEIPEDQIKAALRKRVIESVRKEEAPFVAVICGSAFKNKGVQPLLDAVVDYLPSPL
jgi:energy-coupling factor transporter ATP-binding protein EcfA2